MDTIMTVLQTLTMLVLSVFGALGIEWVCLEGAFHLMSSAASRALPRPNAAKQRPVGSRGPALWR